MSVIGKKFKKKRPNFCPKMYTLHSKISERLFSLFSLIWNFYMSGDYSLIMERTEY